MKKYLSLLLCLLIAFQLCIPCFAAEARIAGTKSHEETKVYTHDGVVIARIAITGSFTYNGSYAVVNSKSISKCETYNGWSFQQTSFTVSGGTITLTGKLTKLFHETKTVSISLTCDAYGNIS